MLRMYLRTSMLIGLILALGCSAPPGKAPEKSERNALRYYAYAPPFIPHEVVNPKCLNCHEQGLEFDGRKAPITPHPELVNCAQCHVYPDPKVKPFRRNRFVGLQETQTLPYPQAYGPPLIPHRVFMREKCLTCHSDPARTEIIQTTHPERWNCRQCHVEQNAQVSLFRDNTNLPDMLK